MWAVVVSWLLTGLLSRTARAVVGSLPVPVSSLMTRGQAGAVCLGVGGPRGVPVQGCRVNVQISRTANQQARQRATHEPVIVSQLGLQSVPPAGNSHVPSRP